MNNKDFLTLIYEYEQKELEPSNIYKNELTLTQLKTLLYHNKYTEITEYYYFGICQNILKYNSEHFFDVYLNFPVNIQLILISKYRQLHFRDLFYEKLKNLTANDQNKLIEKLQEINKTDLTKDIAPQFYLLFDSWSDLFNNLNYKIDLDDTSISIDLLKRQDLLKEENLNKESVSRIRYVIRLLESSYKRNITSSTYYTFYKTHRYLFLQNPLFSDIFYFY